MADACARGDPTPTRSIWRQRARKALDSWAPNSESSVAAAIQDAYHDGIRRAAAFLDQKDQHELAVLVRRLVEDL
jgi:hypothetical protein